MSDTFTQLYYHIVFSTKEREHLVAPARQEELYRYIAGVFKGERSHLIAIGGMPDHIHLLASIPPVVSVSEILRKVKGGSSKWANNYFGSFFRWQSGYGAFSVSRSMLVQVESYILEQEEHHRHQGFKEEFRSLLEKHGIEYDERYLWD